MTSMAASHRRFVGAVRHAGVALGLLVGSAVGLVGPAVPSVAAENAATCVDLFDSELNALENVLTHVGGRTAQVERPGNHDRVVLGRGRARAQGQKWSDQGRSGQSQVDCHIYPPSAAGVLPCPDLDSGDELFDELR